MSGARVSASRLSSFIFFHPWIVFISFRQSNSHSVSREANGAIQLLHQTQRRAMKRRRTYQNIMAMPAKSWIEAATSAFGGNPRMTFDVV